MIYLVYNSDFTELLDVLDINDKEKKEYQKSNKDKVIIKADEINFDDYLESLEDIFEE